MGAKWDVYVPHGSSSATSATQRPYDKAHRRRIADEDGIKDMGRKDGGPQGSQHRSTRLSTTHAAYASLMTLTVHEFLREYAMLCASAGMQL